jgi:hypothetical protein
MRHRLLNSVVQVHERAGFTDGTASSTSADTRRKVDEEGQGRRDSAFDVGAQHVHHHGLGLEAVTGATRAGGSRRSKATAAAALSSAAGGRSRSWREAEAGVSAQLTSARATAVVGMTGAGAAVSRARARDATDARGSCRGHQSR